MDRLVVDPVGAGKESFPSDKLSGQPYISNIHITDLQPAVGIEEAGIINQSMSFSETLDFDRDLFQKPATAWSSLLVRLWIIRSAPAA
jgi:hypothetical protein